MLKTLKEVAATRQKLRSGSGKKHEVIGVVDASTRIAVEASDRIVRLATEVAT